MWFHTWFNASKVKAIAFDAIEYEHNMKRDIGFKEKFWISYYDFDSKSSRPSFVEEYYDGRLLESEREMFDYVIKFANELSFEDSLYRPKVSYHDVFRLSSKVHNLYEALWNVELLSFDETISFLEKAENNPEECAVQYEGGKDHAISELKKFFEEYPNWYITFW